MINITFSLKKQQKFKLAFSTNFFHHHYQQKKKTQSEISVHPFILLQTAFALKIIADHVLLLHQDLIAAATNSQIIIIRNTHRGGKKGKSISLLLPTEIIGSNGSSSYCARFPVIGPAGQLIHNNKKNGEKKLQLRRWLLILNDNQLE